MRDTTATPPLPRAIARNLPKTMDEANASIANLVALGLVTEYSDGTIGVAEAHLRDAAIAAANAAIRK